MRRPVSNVIPKKLSSVLESIVVSCHVNFRISCVCGLHIEVVDDFCGMIVSDNGNARERL